MKQFVFNPKHLYERRRFLSANADPEIADLSSDIPKAFSVISPPEPVPCPKIRKGKEREFLLKQESWTLFNFDQGYSSIPTKTLERILEALAHIIEMRHKDRIKQWKRDRQPISLNKTGFWDRLKLPKGQVPRDEWWLNEEERKAQDTTELIPTRDREDCILPQFLPAGQSQSVSAKHDDELMDIVMNNGNWDWICREKIQWFVDNGFMNQTEGETCCKKWEIPDNPDKMNGYFRPTLVWTDPHDKQLIGAACALQDHHRDFVNVADELSHIPKSLPRRKIYQGEEFHPILIGSNPRLYNRKPWLMADPHKPRDGYLWMAHVIELIESS